MVTETRTGHAGARALRRGIDVPVRTGHAGVRVLRQARGTQALLGAAGVRVLRALREPPAPARPDEWGDAPTQNIDWWVIAQQQGGVPAARRLTVTVPGGEPVELEMTTCTVSKQLGTGYRHTAKVDVVPSAGVWGLVTTPGAVFRLAFGWRFGPSAPQVVSREMGVYLLGEVPKSSRGGAIELNLVDFWKRIEDSRFLSPWSSGTGITRAEAIVSLVNHWTTRLSVPVRILDDGGAINRSVTVARDRTEAITTLARDGRLHVFFDNEGALVIAPEPVNVGGRAVATFTDGAGSKILELSRQVEFTRLYNAVRVNPITEGASPQVWSPVTVHVADESHPRHRFKIGLVPGFFSSPTLTTRNAALAAAKTRLQSLLQELETVEVQTWARGDIEPGDVFSTVETATYANEQRLGTWLTDSVEFDLFGLGTKIQGRNSAVEAVEDEE